jgi:hypothetical protein
MRPSRHDDRSSPTDRTYADANVHQQHAIVCALRALSSEFFFVHILCDVTTCKKRRALFRAKHVAACNAIFRGGLRGYLERVARRSMVYVVENCERNRQECHGANNFVDFKRRVAKRSLAFLAI